MAALPGTIDEWIEINPGEWVHPEYEGVLTLREGLSFTDYWQLRIAKDAAAAADEARVAAYLGDASRQEFLAHLRSDSLAQIESFVRGRINVDAVTDLASAKQCLKRMETGFVTLMKILALMARQ